MTRRTRCQNKTEHDATSWTVLQKTTDKSIKKRNATIDNTRIGTNEESVPEWLHKRREARRNRRKKMKPCFHCREPGHQVTDCPKRKDSEEMMGICFKCGSTEHTVHECKTKVEKDGYPFAKCFICKETGHLSNRCPDNPRGLYPDGGGCKFCGSVEHYRKDCPERTTNQDGSAINKRHKYKTREENQSVDAVDFSEDEATDDGKPKMKHQKLVTF